MKLVAEYLEHAKQFEQMASSEKSIETKKQLMDQAEAYYKLAVKRAREMNLPPPPRPGADSS
jgi:hypothetical protein